MRPDSSPLHSVGNHEDTLWSPQDQCNALARHFSDISKNSTNLPKPVQRAATPPPNPANTKTKSTAFHLPHLSTALAPACVLEPTASPTTRCRLASLDASDGRVGGGERLVILVLCWLSLMGELRLLEWIFAGLSSFLRCRRSGVPGRCIALEGTRE